MNKELLRKTIKTERTNYDIEGISKILAGKLADTEEYANSSNIMIFYPKSGEVNLLHLLKDKSKQFYLPRIKGLELECCPYRIDDELSESKFHTREPVCAPCNSSLIDMVVTPALACDSGKYRLGYGGGFYDRFLSRIENKNVIKIACVPSKFFLNTIYPDKHDVKMDLIITELFNF